MRNALFPIIVATAVFRSIAQAQTSAVQKCRAGKNAAAGKYAACRQSAERRFALNGDAARYGGAIDTCTAHFIGDWQRLESAAARTGSGCVDAPLTEGDFQAVIDAHTTNIATALAGGGFSACSAELNTCNTTLSNTQVGLDVCTGDLAACNANGGSCEASLTTCNADLANCNASLGASRDDLAACQAAPRGQLPKTGQTTCYDASGSATNCSGAQDGALQQGFARNYVDNGDGTITDMNTGLMWEKLSDDNSLHDKDSTWTWQTALGKASLLNLASFAGHADWRLPNIIELLSVAYYGSRYSNAGDSGIQPIFNSGCMPGCSVTACSCDGQYWYWSSTTDTVFSSNAFAFETRELQTIQQSKSTSYPARAVRNAW